MLGNFLLKNYLVVAEGETSDTAMEGEMWGEFEFRVGHVAVNHPAIHLHCGMGQTWDCMDSLEGICGRSDCLTKEGKPKTTRCV